MAKRIYLKYGNDINFFKGNKLIIRKVRKGYVIIESTVEMVRGLRGIVKSQMRLSLGNFVDLETAQEFSKEYIQIMYQDKLKLNPNKIKFTSRSIIAYDNDTKKTLWFESDKEASKYTKCPESRVNHICMGGHKNHHRNRYKNYTFWYEDNKPKNINLIFNKSSSPIIVTDKDNNKKKYNNVYEVSKEYGIFVNDIYNLIKNNKEHNEYKFKMINDRLAEPEVKGIVVN